MKQEQTHKPRDPDLVAKGRVGRTGDLGLAEAKPCRMGKQQGLAAEAQGIIQYPAVSHNAKNTEKKLIPVSY